MISILEESNVLLYIVCAVLEHLCFTLHDMLAHHVSTARFFIGLLFYLHVCNAGKRCL